MKPIELSQICDGHPVAVFAKHFSELDRAVCPMAPFWLDFDPMRVARLLQWMMLIGRQDVTLEGHVIRIMGEGVKQVFSVNLTNMNLGTVFDRETIAIRWRNVIDVAETRKPSFHTSCVPVESRSFIQLYRGCFPFCDENGDIIRLIVVVAPVDVRGMHLYEYPTD
ncbi:hypothetical protein [Pelagibius sp. Alg239-R121]|uniref:hypothetical protein n=2 Tax=Pelagibius sp. Alg239-R121 TaxID=2993448 RepID=UPI0024A651AA|nr:hypothetical protein [Pelagibius sp. Alg239-R121]